MPADSSLIVIRDDVQIVIRAETYTLAIIPERARAVLSAPGGRIWSELSLVAAVNRLDGLDEATGLRPVAVTEGDGEARVVLESDSTAWHSRTLSVRCTPEDVRVSVSVRGTGRIADVTLLGGRAVLASGAAGEFRSSIRFASLFVPTPTDPISVARSAATPAHLGIVGDAEPGRLHGIFSPPPLCFAFGRNAASGPTHLPGGDWLGASIVGGVESLGFTSARYEPLEGGFLLRLAYEGHTAVSQQWSSPEVVLRPAHSPIEAITHYRADLLAHGWADPSPEPVPWVREPIFCGWGAQCAHAVALTLAGKPPVHESPDGFVLPPGASAAPDMARQNLYDGWLERLAERDIVPGTIVIDDRWQLEYGTNRPDPDKWPDLRGWIAQRHAAGQRVLLWFKAWDPAGLPRELCVCDAAGRPVAADPSNPAYLALLHEQVGAIIGPDGLDADGFKIDFTQRAPSGTSLCSYGDTHADSNGLWGIAALHALVGTIFRAAKAAKPDAVTITHTVHPSFGGVSDMVRLNDVLEYDGARMPVPVVDQLRFRYAVAAAALPEHPIDTDQWPMPNRAQWLAYARAQVSFGVPALYYVDSIDNSGEAITDEDLDVVAQTWRRYRHTVLRPHPERSHPERGLARHEHHR
jgi:hypothetical protein